MERAPYAQDERGGGTLWDTGDVQPAPFARDEPGVWELWETGDVQPAPFAQDDGEGRIVGGVGVQELVEGDRSFLDRPERVSQLPAIRASFFARFQPLICLSLARASCLVGNSRVKIRMTGRRVWV